MKRIYSLLTVMILCLGLFLGQASAYSQAEPADIEISSAVFPDDSFREFILRQGYDLNADLKLSADEIESVTQMNCAGVPGGEARIRDLKGIEHFRSLKSLDCSNNMIQELDVSRLTELISLDCSSNMIVALDVSLNAALETLICRDNSLEYLKAAGCYSLVSLDCSENDLKELDIRNCSQLDDLSCQSNDLTVLDVTTAPLIRNYIFTTERADSGEHIAYGEYFPTNAGSAEQSPVVSYHVEMDAQTAPFSNDAGMNLDSGISANPFLITTIIIAYMLTGRSSGRKNGWSDD